MDRPSWDEVWMLAAETISRRSSCVGRQVGAAIVGTGNRYVVMGYNSPPSGFLHAGQDCSHWCARQQTGVRDTSYAGCPSVHAETNAIIQADRHLIEGGTLYITSACCWDCGKIVANSGLKRVVMQVDWKRDAHRRPEDTIEFLRYCGLQVDLWESSTTSSSTSSRISKEPTPSSAGSGNGAVSSE